MIEHFHRKKNVYNVSTRAKNKKNISNNMNVALKKENNNNV